MTDAATDRPLAAVSRWTDYVRTVLLAALPIAAAIGAVFLFAYCSEWRVPMPLELAELPTLLLAIAAIGVALCLFAGCAVLLPLASALMIAEGFWPLYVGRRKALRARLKPNVRARDPARSRRRRQRRYRMLDRVVRVFLLTQGIPALAMAWLILGRGLDDGPAKVATVAGAAIVAVISAWYGYRRYMPRRWQLESGFALLIQIMSQLLWNLQCTRLVLRWLEHFGEGPAWLLIPILFVLPIVLLLPSFLLVFMRIFAPDVLPPTLLVIAICAVIVPAGYTPWGALITADVLHELGMGGGLRVTYVLGDEMPPALCERICDETRPGHSKPLPLLLQVGDRVVVRVEDDVVEFSKQYVVGRVQEAGGQR